jgi:ribose transport system ATP-binding protein
MSVPVLAAPVLAARGVSKSFFGNRVLNEVTIELVPGRTHALLGENGAGKSTLINLLSGALVPDGGTIEIDGRAVSALTPKAAQRAGIAVVQQELSLATHLSIAENIGLGAYPKRFGLIDHAALAQRAAEVCALVGLDEPLDMPVGRLALGRRQMVEIAKALFRKPRVLILDEPTSSLSAHEVRTLTGLVRRLRTEGVAVLYISHRLNEVLDLCDYTTILKDGVRTADRPLAGVDPAGLVRLMVGRDPGDLFPPRTASAPGAVAVAVREFSAGEARGVDLDLRYGEIVGIGGLVGQGQEDFLLGLYGALPATARHFQVGDVGVPFHDVAAANRSGLAYVPADRKKEALLLPHTIAFNLLLPFLPRLTAGGLRDRGREAETVRELVGRFTIKGDVRRAVQALSGGNQQKVALAKWMPLEPRILLLNDPTRGVDVETKREIYLMLRDFARQGQAILLLSSDTPELVHLCDRVAVFHGGRVATLLEGDAIGEEAIVAAAMGIGARQERAA